MTNGKISLCRHSWSAQQISGDDFVEQDPLLFLVLDYVGEALVRWCIDLVYSLFHKYKIIAPFKGFLSKSMKCFAFILSLLLLSISNAVFVLDEEEQEHGNVRSRDLQDEDLDPNPDSWIVQFAPGTTGVANRAANLAKKNGGTVGAVFTTAIQGFVFNGKNVEGISQNPNVISVTRDSIHSVTAQSVPTGIKRIFATSKSYMTAATSSCFCDAVVAVIDTGVDFTHPDLKVDTKKSVDCTSGECVSGGLDGHGHGTHVSGTIGAINNGQGVVGVCPGALIWAVKVLNNRGSGYTSWIIKGIDYVAQNAATVDVANMSLGGSGCDQTYCSAITAAKNAGVAFAVAAGNSNDIADKYTPACCDDALTVSSLADSDGAAGGKGGPTSCYGSADDKLSSFSNYGSGVNIAAPGECIYSTNKASGYTTMSGTSMASPHVAGALAVLASNNHGGDVQTMYNTLTDKGNKDYTDNKDNVQEPLLDMTNLPNANIVCPTNSVLPPSKAPTMQPVASPTQACLIKGSVCSTTQPTPSCCSGLTCKLNNRKGGYTCAVVV